MSKTCANCKHEGKHAMEYPCCTCGEAAPGIAFDKWEPKAPEEPKPFKKGDRVRRTDKDATGPILAGTLGVVVRSERENETIARSTKWHLCGVTVKWDNGAVRTYPRPDCHIEHAPPKSPKKPPPPH